MITVNSKKKKDTETSTMENHFIKKVSIFDTIQSKVFITNIKKTLEFKHQKEASSVEQYANIITG